MVVVQVMKIENDVDVIAFMVRRLTGVHKYVFLFSTAGLRTYQNWRLRLFHRHGEPSTTARCRH